MVISAISAIGLAYFAWIFIGGGLEKQTTKEMQRVENQVAGDSEKQYEIARESGTPMDRCVHAGFVSAAYIQAKDQENYAKWKEIESRDCEAAGLPK